MLIVTLADEAETQPDWFVTVKVYMPAGITDIVAVVPEPVVVTPPGVLVTVQFPIDGNPLRTTVPVDIAQVGWVMVPIVGAVGVGGWVFITTLAEDGEVHPVDDVTVKVWVPAARPPTVVVDPDPMVVPPPGLRVRVQLPAGKPLRTTLPVETSHVGWVKVPTTGAVGMALTVRV